MSLPYKGELIPRAKEMRKNATPQENHLWYDFLCTYPVRFQRQKTITSFIVDFYCSHAKLAVEIDGSQHFSTQGKAYDTERSAVLDKFGIVVLRFSNDEVDSKFNDVCNSIHVAVQNRLASINSQMAPS